MIIKNFLTDRHKFIIAKNVSKKKKAELITNYKKLVEKCFILSLLITIFLFQLYPRQSAEKSNKESIKVSLEVVDIPVTKQEKPPPPPPPVQEVMTNYSVVVKKEQNDIRKLREEIEDVTLDLELETEESLLASSQINDIPYAEFARRRSRFNEGISLEIDSNLNNSRNRVGGGLEFDLATQSTSKRFVDDAVDLESPPIEPVNNSRDNEIAKTKNELITISKNQFLLKESESTIGTNEYRLWNKINAALDRLDKNRFGNLPHNVERTRKGLNASFTYTDGIIHEIFWSKGGKVVIRVTGRRPRELVSELQKAFDAIIHLTL